MHIANRTLLACLDSVMKKIYKCSISHSSRYLGYHRKTGTIGKSAILFSLNAARAHHVESVLKIMTKFVLMQVAMP